VFSKIKDNFFLKNKNKKILELTFYSGSWLAIATKVITLDGHSDYCKVGNAGLTDEYGE
jgi:hypothetical protein